MDQTQASEPGIMKCDGKAKSTSYTDLLCLGVSEARDVMYDVDGGERERFLCLGSL